MFWCYCKNCFFKISTTNHSLLVYENAGDFFHILICHLYLWPLIFIGVSDLCDSFFKQAVFLLLSFKSSSCILGNSPLSDVSFTNTLTQFVACLFIVLTVSFIRSFHLDEIRSTYSFVVHDFGVVSRKPNPRLSKFSPMLSSRNFIVLHFTFMFVIHFRFIFVNGVKIVSRFVFVFVLHPDAQCSSTNRWKDLSWRHFIAFTPEILPPFQCLWVFPHHRAILWHQLSVQQFNSVLTLSTPLIWR